MFIVDLRMCNPGPAKYLIDTWSFNDFMSAYNHAKEIASKLDKDHFVELREEHSYETIKKFE